MVLTRLEPLIEAFGLIGEDPRQVLSSDTAHLVAFGHNIASQQSIPEVEFDVESTPTAIRARVAVANGCRVATPIHLCFGLFERFGTQNVVLDMALGTDSEATVWSHCLFTIPEVARHSMDATIAIGVDATLKYQETHYHGISGGIEVIPNAEVKVEPRGRYLSDFSLVQGRVGKLNIDYRVDVGANAVAELTSRVYGHGADEIRICEQLDLNGERARGLIKSRVAVENEAIAEVIGITEGNAAGARGHVDCLEIVRDQAVVSAVPKVRVSHPLAKVTHEAAIGSVDTKQLETLMARGLEPERAVDIIVRGMLR